MPDRNSVAPMRWQTRNISFASGGHVPAFSSGASSGGSVRGEATFAGATSPETPTERASGMDHIDFGFANLAASQTALQATRDFAGTQSTVGATMPWAGSVIGLAFQGNGTMSAGAASFTVYISGEAQTATLDWTTGLSSDVTTFTAATVPFDAGEVLDVRASTDGAYTPTTTDIIVTVYVSYQS